MEEITNVMTESTPQEEVIDTEISQEEVIENTTETEPSENEETKTTDIGTEPNTEAQGEGKATHTEADVAPTVTIRFNHKTEELSIEDAAVWAQKGKAAESSMAKLRYLAASMGKGVNEVLNYLVEANDKKREREILEEVGGNENAAKELSETRKARIEKAVADMVAAEKAEQEQDQKDLSERLANEFAELTKEVPEIKTLNDVPKSVMNEAVKSNISLFDVYLRYERKQRQSIEKAQKQAETIKNSAPSSLTSADKTAGTQDFSAFNSGVWGYHKN